MIDAKLEEITVKTETSKSKVTTAIRNFKEELKKVSWTTKEELKLFTKIVVAATFILGLSIYLVDLSIKGCLQLVAKVAHWIFG